MTKIGEIYLGRMNNAAHFLFITDVLARAEANEAMVAKVATQVNNLKTALAKEDECFKLSTKSLTTDEITKADAERDSLYISYKLVVAALLRHPVADMAMAAKVLNQHIKDYNINTRMQLDKETGAIINFITDLEGKYKSEVEMLALTPYVAKLKEVNESLRGYTGTRTNERMATVVGALKAARAVTDEAYRALVDMVNALALVEGDTVYADFITYVNTEITHYKREVLGQTASSSSKTGDTTTDSDAPVIDEGTTDGGSEDDVPDLV